MNKPVSYELAEMLKEKGFNLKVVNFYNYGKLSLISDKDRQIGKLTIYNPINWNFVREHYTSAPTIAEVIMWLYEKYGIWISVYTMDKWLPNGNDREQMFDYSVKQMKLGLIDIPKKPEEFSSPTEAYESAIKYALLNLI